MTTKYVYRKIWHTDRNNHVSPMMNDQDWIKKKIRDTGVQDNEVLLYIIIVRITRWIPSYIYISYVL